MVEGARLESVYTSKGYRGFESLSLRKISLESLQQPVNCDFQAVILNTVSISFINSYIVECKFLYLGKIQNLDIGFP